MARKQSNGDLKYGIDTSEPAAYWVPIEKLKRWVKNPRKNKRAVAAAVASIKEFGFGAPLVAQYPEGGVEDADEIPMIAGDTRIQAAEILGIKFLPVRCLKISTKKAHALGIADNKVGEFAVWDKPLLDEGLTEFKDNIPMFEATGFKYVDYFPDKPTVAPDTIPAPPPAPITKLGEVWQLGEHVLICGDSFDAKIRDRVLRDKPIDLVVTDPPYAMYGSSTGIGSDIADDKMVRPFFEQMFRLIEFHTKEFAHAYVCCDWRSWAAITESARKTQMVAKNVLVWDKGNSGLGSMYAMTHEFIGFFAHQSKQTGLRSTTKKGHRTVLGPNVIRHNRVQGEERQHNAAKPVEMFKGFINNSSDEKQLVVDFFAGSGTTLIACEYTKRRAIVFEIEPACCDIIIARWEKLVSRKAVRL